jgi:hypothetical protein
MPPLRKNSVFVLGFSLELASLLERTGKNVHYLIVIRLLSVLRGHAELSLLNPKFTLIALVVSAAAFALVLFRKRTEYSGAKILQLCAMELCALPLIALAIRLHISLFHVILYHVIFWTIYPLNLLGFFHISTSFALSGAHPTPIRKVLLAEAYVQ